MPIYMIYAAGIVFIYFIIGFIIAQVKKDNSIADILWGLGFVLLAGSLFFLTVFEGHTLTIAQRFAFYLPLIWGLRLTYFLFKRHKKVGEDYRYTLMRKQWGDKQKSHAFFKVFMVQGVFQYIIALSFIVIFAFPLETTTSLSNYGIVIGLTVWTFGFVFETVADQQMRNFKHRPEMKGRILKIGLWKYSRHPNYFGEATLWWGIYIITLTNVAAPYNYIAIISPLTITYLLRFVSGVPLLERKLMKHQEYQTYAQRTNTFFPFFPKKTKTHQK